MHSIPGMLPDSASIEGWNKLLDVNMGCPTHTRSSPDHATICRGSELGLGWVGRWWGGGFETFRKLKWQMRATNIYFLFLRKEKLKSQSGLTPVWLQQERQRAANIALHPDSRNRTTPARPTPDGAGQGACTGQE